jgi:hypothetical protein
MSKANDKRIERAYGRVVVRIAIEDGGTVAIDMLDIPRVFEVGERLIRDGATEGQLEGGLTAFVRSIMRKDEGGTRG